MVVVTKCTPKSKVSSIQRYGAVVVFCDNQNVNSRERKAERIARERGLGFNYLLT